MSAPESGYASCEERPALVAPGKYEVTFERHFTWMMFGKAPKITIIFRIVSMGPHFQTRIPRHYNVKRLIGRASSGGRFKVGFTNDFLRDFSRLFGTPHRLDRVPMSSFQDRVIIASVRTVSKGADQRDIPPGLQYSVVDELHEVKQ